MIVGEVKTKTTTVAGIEPGHLRYEAAIYPVAPFEMAGALWKTQATATESVPRKLRVQPLSRTLKCHHGLKGAYYAEVTE